MSKSFAGVDPGVNGCLAIVRPDGAVEFHEPPTVAVKLTGKTKTGGDRHRSEYLFSAIADILRESRIDFVTIEKVVAMPAFRGGARVPLPASMAQQAGVGFGMWLMGFACFRIACQVVPAATWKKAVMADHAKTKEGSVVLASRLYPQVADQLTTPRGRILDGRAEALLLAHYGRATGSAGSET